MARLLWFGVFSIFLSACQSDSDPKTQNTPAATSTLSSGVRLDFIDQQAAPGENFFRYANGRWLDETEIPADKARYGAFTMLADKAQEDVKAIVQNTANREGSSTPGTEAQQIADFYRSALDLETIEKRGLEPLQLSLNAIASLKDYDSLSAYFAIASRRGVTTPLNFFIDQDEKAPNTYIVYFSQSGLGLPDRDNYLSDDDNNSSLLADYQSHIAAMFKLAGLSDGEAAATAIVAMETKMAQAQWPRAQMRDRERTYNKVSRQTLANRDGGFSWTSYFGAADITTGEDVILRSPDFLKSLGELVGNHPLEHWRWYLQWHTLDSYASLLPQAIDDGNFAFYGTRLRGIDSQQERWKRAINWLDDYLGDAVGKLYVEEHFKPEAKARMVELVENLREAYRQGILELDWMGEETKAKAIDKLNKFNPKIGYPDTWRDLSGIRIAADDFFGNVMRAREFQYQREVKKLGQPVDRDEWFMNPQTVNAYYNPGMNEIVFPAAILQPPFFNVEADDAINYGAIGAVIGHEMGHGFDDQGAKSNGDGLLENWWTEQDLAEFTRRTEKLVEQYNGYTVLDGVAINGSLTQGENIGDLGGLTIAYKAYQLYLQEHGAAPVIDDFTGPQRFFLGWAQVWANKYRDAELRRRILTDSHSPPLFRTNGVLRNMPEFYQAFGIEEGQWMYLPENERVKIW